MESNQPSPSATANDTTPQPILAGNELPELTPEQLAKLVADKRRDAGYELSGHGLPPLLKPPKPEAIPAAETEADRASREERDRAWQDQEARERNEQKFRDWATLIGQRGSRYNECRLANFKATDSNQKAAIERLTEYGQNIRENYNAGRSIVWFGPPGTGKDHLMMAMARIAIGAELRLSWRNGSMLWAEFRATMDEDSERNEMFLIKQLTAPDILAISDPLPPVGKLSDYQATSLFTVIDSRYSHQKPTWLTLNVANRREAEDRMGTQVVRRIADGALVVVCNWAPHKES